jgi:GNAT superfamily N-acetyltransferase
MPIQIRRATIHDLERLTELRLEFVADVRQLDLAALRGEFAVATSRFLRSSFETSALHAWFAEEDGDAVGVVSVVLHLVPPRPNEHRLYEGYIINMYVKPPARGRGVARGLMASCLASADELDISRFTLHATAEGRPLYEKLGFDTNDDWLELPPIRC